MWVCLASPEATYKTSYSTKHTYFFVFLAFWAIPDAGIAISGELGTFCANTFWDLFVVVFSDRRSRS